MITLLTHSTGHPSYHFDVLLDVTAKDLSEVTAETRSLFKEAKTAQRKVGCIRRKYRGETFFTYAAAHEAQLEVTLLATLSPRLQIDVSVDSDGGSKWDHL